MSIFYQDELVIYGLSINSFIPFNVQDDVLSKVRKNFFEHNRRQNDKLVQNIQDITIKYTYNLEKNKSMKWVVQKNKKTIEDSVIVSVNSYEIRTYNDKGEKICTTEYSNDHILKQVAFNLNGETVVISSGKEDNTPVLFLRNSNGSKTLKMLQINERNDVTERLKERNPYITVTAFTNLGLVYFGTDEEINNVNNIIKEIKLEIIEENSPTVYITKDDVESGFNFKDNDFNLKRNMNETYNIDKTEYFSFEDSDIPEEAFDNTALEEKDETTPAEVKEIIEDNADESTSEAIADVDSVDVESGYNPEPEEITEPENKEEPVVENEESVSEEPENADAEDIAAVLAEDESTDNTESVVEESEENPQTDEESSDTTETENIPEPENKEESVSEESDVEKDSTPVNDNNAILQQVIDAMVESGAQIRSDEEGESPIRFSSVTSNQSDKEADLIINSGGEKYYYYGELDDDLHRDGYGRTEMSNGKTAYEGNYKDNKREGFGSFYYKDGGLCYTGEWKDNKREGFGVGLRSSDGSFHAGGWSNNKPNGVGVRFDKYGKFSYATNFVGGKEEGLCVQFNEDGSLTIFKWENDSKKIIERIYP